MFVKRSWAGDFSGLRNKQIAGNQKDRVNRYHLVAALVLDGFFVKLICSSLSKGLSNICFHC